MERVLFVDDSQLIRAMYKQVFSTRKQLTLEFAKTGLEALECIQRDGEPRVMFVDINMPVMNGLELLQRLNETGAGARIFVVLVTTEGTDEDVARGLAAGAKAYVRKPFKPTELLALLDRGLDASQKPTVRSGGRGVDEPPGPR